MHPDLMQSTLSIDADEITKFIQLDVYESQELKYSKLQSDNKTEH